ncbi:MAG: adenylate/guanylate cyclase domain-containing protein [Ramlibacter sp.]
MPVHNIASLTEDQPQLGAFANRLAGLESGIVLTTGQASSGKITMLLALAQVVAKSGQMVKLLADRPEPLKPFHPLPTGWEEVSVQPTAEGWDEALRAAPPSALIVAALVSRENAPAVWAASANRCIFASLDTALIGIDASYALREMGITAEEFVERTRCVWSQFLVSALCEKCAKPAQLSRTEMEDLFPGDRQFSRILAAGQCPECAPGKYRVAVCEALLINDTTRPAIVRALQEGTAPQIGDKDHIKVQDQARDLVDQGRIGVEAYRDTIRRNPLLRAQNTLEREQAHSYRLGAVFEKFVSPEVKRRLMDSKTIDTVVNGESREITCLFCDIRGFTARAETLPPETLFAELNRYFAEVVDCVLANEGTIDKFIGDAVMVVFGAPMAQPDQAQRALACALAIRERVVAFNESNPEKPPIAVGMGLNSGTAMAGCIGTDRRMEYTVLGDAVNIAARLESRAKPGQVLVSQSTRALAGDAFKFGTARSFELKGKAADVEASELLGRA